MSIARKLLARMPFERYQPSRHQFSTDVESVECIGETTTSSNDQIGTNVETFGGSTDEWQIRGSITCSDN
jgi:hypothetical protein